MKHKSAIVGETIVFSICNKLFKPQGLSSGQVKSCEGLPEMIPIDILKHYVNDKQGLPHKDPYH
jgi:hypothetical protein